MYIYGCTTTTVKPRYMDHFSFGLFLFFFFLLCFLLERYAQTFFQGENIGEKKKERKKKNPFTSA
jgi:hypothetical protein